MSQLSSMCFEKPWTKNFTFSTGSFFFFIQPVSSHVLLLSAWKTRQYSSVNLNHEGYLWVVNIRRWAQGTCEFSVLVLQLFCKSKNISKYKMIFKSLWRQQRATKAIRISEAQNHEEGKRTEKSSTFTAAFSLWGNSCLATHDINRKPQPRTWSSLAGLGRGKLKCTVT